MDEAERCHRVGLVHRGRLLEDGEPRTLMKGFASFEEAFLSRLGEAP
jgi:ABC-type multidrug transport system ATPase subunit